MFKIFNDFYDNSHFQKNIIFFNAYEEQIIPIKEIQLIKQEYYIITSKGKYEFRYIYQILFNKNSVNLYYSK